MTTQHNEKDTGPVTLLTSQFSWDINMHLPSPCYNIRRQWPSVICRTVLHKLYVSATAS